MNALYALFLVFALVLIATFGVGAAHLNYVFGVCLPYTAFIIFLVGFCLKIIKWARRPVPFSIPTTGGQQKSLDWIKHEKWDNPTTLGQTWVRMLLEVLCFRSLFRNTKTELAVVNGRPVVGYASSKWLWLFALMFHYAFFIILVRHFRLFMEPVPFFVAATEYMDGIFQIGVPRLYMSDMLILFGAGFLLFRRIINPAVRYISLTADFFPLILILGIAISGMYMRYFAKVDVVAIKELTMGVLTFHVPHPIPPTIDVSFYVHLFLVCVLLVYFPFSKLMHLGGVFLSPTRNLPNTSRRKHYTNPWNDPSILPHSYAAYEDDFREPMFEAGLPLEKQPDAKPAEQGARGPKRLRPRRQLQMNEDKS